MYIGNVGIFVKDLKGARRFFESYFGAKLLKSYNEPELTSNAALAASLKLKRPTSPK